MVQEKEEMVRKRVLYIGSAVPLETAEGLDGVQKPLMERLVAYCCLSSLNYHSYFCIFKIMKITMALFKRYEIIHSELSYENNRANDNSKTFSSLVKFQVDVSYFKVNCTVPLSNIQLCHK